MNCHDCKQGLTEIYYHCINCQRNTCSKCIYDLDETCFAGPQQISVISCTECDPLCWLDDTDPTTII